MMVPKKSLILAGAALAVLGATAGAQSQKAKLFKRAGGSVRQAHLDLGTGTYTRGPIVNQRGIGTTNGGFRHIDAFDGSGFGWLSVDTGAGACRWFNPASKGLNIHQAPIPNPKWMTDIVFFYCSNALDVSSGGVGGSVNISFYEGYTVFGGTPTTTAAVVQLTELPANTSDGSFFSAGAGCYGIRITFTNLVAFRDCMFMGYSWEYADVGTDGILGNTYPFISCVVSCSGLNIINGSAGGAGIQGLGLGDDGQGSLDVIDQFCTIPAGTVTATFTFGTVAPPFAPTTRTSVNMEIWQKIPLATTNVNYNALTTPNADTLSATKASLGATWTATFTRAAGTGGAALITVKAARHPLPNGGNPTGPVTGRVLTAGVLLITLPSATIVGTTATAATAVPLDPIFCNLHFAAQARRSGGSPGGLVLSSGVEGTIGTF
jgi:hypothetical protein